MKLKHGKKYETADGVVYRVLLRETGTSFEVAPEDPNQWSHRGLSMSGGPQLIRRHYTKPKPAHKLDLKPGDVVELVAWEDGSDFKVGTSLRYEDIEIPLPHPKGARPLFRVVPR